MACHRIVNRTFNLDRSGLDTPCSSDFTNGVVQCCERGHTCMAFGLCYIPNPVRGASGYYTSSCTDPLVEDPACVKYCATETFVDTVWNATARNWVCCGHNKNGIQCANPIGATFEAPAPEDLGIYSSTRTSSSSSTSSATSSTSSPSPTSAATFVPVTVPASGSPSDFSAGAAAGTAIGAAAVAALLIAFIWWLLRKKRIRRRMEEGIQVERRSRLGGIAKYYSSKHASKRRPEQQEAWQKSEMDGEETARKKWPSEVNLLLGFPVSELSDGVGVDNGDGLNVPFEMDGNQTAGQRRQ